MATPRTAHGAERCDAIVAVARRVLVDEGLDAFGMRRIAQLAGMHLGNLQYYFATRDDLLEAVVHAELARDLARLRRGRGTDPERRLEDALRALLAAWGAGGGSVYVPASLLALHDERFASLCCHVCGEFHVELAAAVRAVDPTADAHEATARAVLITALVDGGSLQMSVIDAAARRRLVADLAPIAVSIARGRDPSWSAPA